MRQVGSLLGEGELRWGWLRLDPGTFWMEGKQILRGVTGLGDVCLCAWELTKEDVGERRGPRGHICRPQAIVILFSFHFLPPSRLLGQPGTLGGMYLQIGLGLWFSNPGDLKIFWGACLKCHFQVLPSDSDSVGGRYGSGI